MRRDRVTERIDKGEVAAERAIFRCEHNGRPVPDEMIVQRIGIVASEPESDALTEVVVSAELGDRRAHGERNGSGIEDHGAGRALGCDLQPHDIGVESPCRIEIMGLNADEVGAGQMGHDNLSCA
jgi:hypothetical protein